MKLFKKFFFTTAVIILVSLTVMISIVTFAITNYFSNEKFDLLTQNCSSISKIAIADMTSANFKRNLYNIITIQNEISDIDIFVCNNKGQIVVCGCRNFQTEMNCMHTKNTVSTEILAQIHNDDYYKMGNLGGVYSTEHYTVATRISDHDNSVYGYVFASASTESLRTLLKSLFKIYLFSAIIPIILMFFSVFTISYNQTKPLKFMSEAAKSMAEGDFSKRVPVLNDDEIGELSVAFNNMTDSLAQMEGMRRSFIGNVSHELRTPMTTIAGFIDGIIDGTIPEDKHNEYLKTVSDEVKRLSRIVESMLNISRLESGALTLNKTKFDLSSALINVVLSRETTIEKYNLQIDGLDTLQKAEICADYDLIYQVLYNLVDNAVKFTNENGRINFAIYNTNNQIELAVKNTGEGIEKEQLSLIFDRFYKVDKSRSNNKNSSGLGLFIVKTIVKLHGGKIIAESVPGEFTIFRVILPKTNIEGTDKNGGK